MLSMVFSKWIKYVSTFFKVKYGFHCANLTGNISNHLFVLFAGLGYKHKAVNHFQEYVITEGVHTNHIESLWRDTKRKLKSMNGARRSFLPSYLVEWLWRRQRSKDQCFQDLAAAVATNPKYEVWTLPYPSLGHLSFGGPKQVWPIWPFVWKAWKYAPLMCAPQTSIFCCADFGSTFALGV